MMGNRTAKGCLLNRGVVAYHDGRRSSDIIYEIRWIKMSCTMIPGVQLKLQQRSPEG